MSSTALPVPFPLRTWVAGGLLALLAFGACWTGAIVYWRTRAGDPDTMELMLCLFLLPGSLLAAALFARNRLSAPPQAATTTPAASDLVAPQRTATRQPAPLAILATAVRSPHGASVEEIAAALAGRKARPALDAELVDDDGFPVMTARCPEANDPALHADIATWLAADDAAIAFTEEQRRALVLATAVTAELAGALPPPDASTATIQLVPVLAKDWGASQRDAAARWLRDKVAQSGWPAARIAVIAPVDADLFHTVPAMLAATPAPVIAMVIASASHIGDDPVQAWAAHGALYTASHPAGKIPGEGAVGLLLTDIATATAADGALYAILEPLHTGRRNASADDHRGPPQPMLAGLAASALAAAQVAPDALTMLAADTGPATSRMLEVLGYASAATPQLDTEDIVTWGHASGVCGAVPALTALALARLYACERNAPVLWLAHDDPFQCCAAVLHMPART
jgi:hypothetical protein